MHTHPAWRLWLVAIVMLAALVLALPNVFGEGPALQLSRDARARFSEAHIIGRYEDTYEDALRVSSSRRRAREAGKGIASGAPTK